MKNNRGVTLIALIITLVVMVILAGVAMSAFDKNGIMNNAEKAVDQSKVNNVQTQIRSIITKLIYESSKNVTINEIIEALEKQGLINIGDSNSETGEVKTKLDGYVFRITETANDWEVKYIGTGEITPSEIVLVLSHNTKGITNEVIITMTAKAESGIASYTLPKGTPQSVASGTKEITQTVTATENGTYVFTVVNGNGESVTKSIKIDNILKDAIQISASPSEYTYDNVTVTIMWPERSNQAVKQVKVGESAWQTVTGSKTQLTITKNTIIRAKVQNSVADIVSNTLTVNNILQAGTIPIYTEEQLLKIGTGEVLEIEGKLYELATSRTYEIKNDIEYTGDYTKIGNRIKENSITIKGKDNRVIVTTASGNKEYYTEDSKYYIAVNKYGYVLDGLIAYYDGIDNTGTGVHDRTARVWKDLSGNGNDGQLNYFGDSIISGWGKDYLAFDGIDDWVNCGIINSENMSLEIGYNLKVRDNYNRVLIGKWMADTEDVYRGNIGLVTYGENFQYETSKDGRLKITYVENDVNKNQFYTNTITYDGMQQWAYSNGKIKNIVDMAEEEMIGDAIMAIGADFEENGQAEECWHYNNMNVYVARIYDRALSAEEIEINNKTDKKRFDSEEIIKIYTAEQLLNMENNTEATYELKNNITLSSDFTEMASKIGKGEIKLKGEGYNIVDVNGNYYTEASDYCVPVNQLGYIGENLILHYDAINNTGNGHSTSTSTWKDLSGNGNDATVSGSYVWKDNAFVFEASTSGLVLQNTTFSNKTSFTLSTVGSFYEASGKKVWPMIVSTVGTWGAEHWLVNGLDYFIAEDARHMYMNSGDGVAEHYYGRVESSSVGRPVTITANWDYLTKKLIDSRGSDMLEKIITTYDNIRLFQISLGVGREVNDICGRYTYNSVKLYDRSLSDEEMSVNNRNDRIRFETEYWNCYEEWDGEVNRPQLADGMIPITYNETEKVWEITYDEEKWYDYSEQKWANVMLSDGKYKAGTTAIEGTKVQESELGSMFVWIPRYAYSITNNYHNGGVGVSGTIEIEFLKGTSKVSSTGRGVWDNASGENNWNIHPAFTHGGLNGDYANGGWDREIPGIWVAKFEASSSNPSATDGGGDVTTLNVKVLPNVTSWRNIGISNMFTNCLNMNKTGNIYGIPINAITHQMKNTEWGAVAYLAHSEYGRNGAEVTINNSSTYITGNAGDTVDATLNAGVTNAYNTAKGVLASTTGNVYGIYDMNGGTDEYVAATLEVFRSIVFANADNKFIDVYSGEGKSEELYEVSKEKYGDATYEVSKAAAIGNNSDGWCGDGCQFLRSKYDDGGDGYAGVVKRGNAYDRGVNAGIWSAHNSLVAKLEDMKAVYTTFRPTIIIE